MRVYQSNRVMGVSITGGVISTGDIQEDRNDANFNYPFLTFNTSVIHNKGFTFVLENVLFENTINTTWSNEFCVFSY